MTNTPAVITSLGAIMAAVQAIGKDRENTQQNFKFRGIDQMYNALHDLFAEHCVIMTPRTVGEVIRRERVSRNGGVLGFTLIKVEYDFISTVDGSKLTIGPVLGEGMDSGDKGANKALSIAHKYALIQTFLIPTEDIDDPDRESHELSTDQPPSDDWGELDDWGTPEAPPAQSKPAPAFVVDDEQVKIVSELDAESAAKLLARLAMNVHGGSEQELRDFWAANKRIIDHIAEYYPGQFKNLQAVFVNISNQLNRSTS